VTAQPSAAILQCKIVNGREEIHYGEALWFECVPKVHVFEN
jgi:hypothetical protein